MYERLEPEGPLQHSLPFPLKALPLDGQPLDTSMTGTILRTLLEQSAGLGLANLLDAKKAQQCYRQLRGRHEEESRRWRHLQADPEQDIFLGLREPHLKNAALYVDLDTSGKVLSPTNRVEERDARMSIGSLE